MYVAVTLGGCPGDFPENSAEVVAVNESGISGDAFNGGFRECQQKLCSFDPLRPVIPLGGFADLCRKKVDKGTFAHLDPFGKLAVGKVSDTHSGKQFQRGCDTFIHAV